MGGGQLARLLALAAHPLGLNTRVLVANADDPAAQVTDAVLTGSKPADYAGFVSGLSHVTFESEFIDVAALEDLPDVFFPSLAAIGVIQDRLSQKRLLDQHRIPTSPWVEAATEADLDKVPFGEGYVLKARRFGYDGYGTFPVKSGGTPDPRWRERLNNGFIAEEFVNFRRELATSFVRGCDGTFRALPLVESVQVDARCFSVRGPVTHQGLPKLTKQFKRLMNELDYVGILAVELFDVGGRLIVNELAPRVHNSAHYSQDALTCSQFEYHLRAGLGLPLPKVHLRAPGFAMVNLLGEGGEVRLNYAHDGWLHWYGKRENRAGRKLGHVNVVDRTGAAALKRALRWRKDIQL